jgi:hypothetical protein
MGICGPREQGYACRREVQRNGRSQSSSSGYPRASGLNSIVKFESRQLHYLVGNASTDYEDESYV